MVLCRLVFCSSFWHKIIVVNLWFCCFFGVLDKLESKLAIYYACYAWLYGKNAHARHMLSMLSALTKALQESIEL